MSDPETGQGGVFGNLPDSRPGGRSPRRDAPAKPRKAAARATGRRKAKPAATATEPRPEPVRRRPDPPAPEPDAGSGLEDIAWAGVAAAAEAATLGVRLANRALEALRGSSERT